MAFVLEDGTGVAGANAYLSASAVTAYLTDRGRETENGWDTLSTAAQQAAIIKATDYVEKRFFGRWLGNVPVANTAQDLSWPRSGVTSKTGRLYVDTAIPAPLLEAIAEYSVRAAVLVLLPDPSPAADNSSGIVTRLKEKVGPLEVDTTFKDTNRLSSADLRAYPAADLLIEQLTGINNSIFGFVGRA